MYIDTKRLNAATIANFLSRLNILKEHHIGYVGNQEDEILAYIEQEFDEEQLDRFFTAAYKDDTLVGLLGLDVDHDTKKAEIWGPYLAVEDSSYLAAAIPLWEQAINKVEGAVKEYYGFYNQENVNGRRFMEALQAEKKSTQIIMKMKNPQVDFQMEYEVQELESEFADSFVKLHDMVFKNTYYSGNEISGRINADNKLFLAVEDGMLAGYCYVEGNPAFDEGSVEFIAVAEQFRKLGIGKALLYSGLNHLFMQLGVEEISICVDDANQGAIQLYKAAGFQEEHILDAYHYRAE